MFPRHFGRECWCCRKEAMISVESRTTPERLRFACPKSKASETLIGARLLLQSEISKRQPALIFCLKYPQPLRMLSRLAGIQKDKARLTRTRVSKVVLVSSPHKQRPC